MERAAVAVSARAREGSEIAGRVRIALPTEFASHWLAPKLPGFRRAYPRIELQILVGTRQRDLSRGEAELAVQSPRPHQQSVIVIRIGRATAALYSSRASRPQPKRIDGTYAGEPLSLLTYLPAFNILQDAKWFQPVLASSHIVIETNSTHTLLAGVRAGLGIGVLPRFVARDQDDLVQVSENVAATDVWLITHPEFRRDPKVRATADFLKRIAAGPDGLS